MSKKGLASMATIFAVERQVDIEIYMEDKGKGRRKPRIMVLIDCFVTL